MREWRVTIPANEGESYPRVTITPIMDHSLEGLANEAIRLRRFNPQIEYRDISDWQPIEPKDILNL